jgi:hypothetical protein
MQRPCAVAQEQRGHRRAGCGDWERAREDGEHLPHVGFGGGDAGPAQRPARRAWHWRSAGQFQDVLPALGESAAPGWRDDLPGTDGHGPAGVCRASRRELAIQRRGERAGQEATPWLTVVRCWSKERVSGH